MTEIQKLSELAAKADAELAKEEARLEEQRNGKRQNRGSDRNKRKNGEMGKEAKKDAQKQNNSVLQASADEDPSFQDVFGEDNMNYANDPDLELDPAVFDDPGSDPFEKYASEISKEGTILDRPSGSGEAGQRNDDTNRHIPKLSGKRRVGEEISREEAEQVLSGKPPGGHRATILYRTRVVESRNTTSEDRAADIGKNEVFEKSDSASSSESPRILCMTRMDTGEFYEITRNLTVGRGEDNDIVIPRPEGHCVSENHALICIQGKDVYVKDLDSLNGTFLNGRKIKSIRIKRSDLLAFADIEFAVSEK